MSDLLLRDESITISLPAMSTTARTLAFLWYALSENPDVAVLMRAEIDAVLGDEAPTLAHLKQLPYTLQVIKETLRLYPAAAHVCARCGRCRPDRRRSRPRGRTTSCCRT